MTFGISSMILTQPNWQEWPWIVIVREKAGTLGSDVHTLFIPLTVRYKNFIQRGLIFLSCLPYLYTTELQASVPFRSRSATFCQNSHL